VTEVDAPSVGVPNGSHEVNGQMGNLFFLAIISRDNHVISATMALILVAGFFIPQSLWSIHVYSRRRMDDTQGPVMWMALISVALPRQEVDGPSCIVPCEDQGENQLWVETVRVLIGRELKCSLT
jgi:hypothetical protein